VQQTTRLCSASALVRSDGLIDAEIDNEIVALDIESGMCYGLNRVGSRIWRLLSEPIRVGDLCATLQREYKVAPADCERQVLDLLHELHAEGLIGTAEATAQS
jgi:Coenzyme PQQ synthesis protein D (PqqD)